MKEDYYKILGVDKNASKEDIKKVYRSLARKYHPDMEGGDEEMFKKISYSYDVLTDENKRKNYDKFGDPNGPKAGGGFNRREGNPFGFKGGMGMDDEDLFSMFNRAKNKQHHRTKGNDLKAEVSVDIKQIFDGVSKKIAYTRKKACEDCGGKGGKGNAKKCSTCKGNGFFKRIERTPLGQLERFHECHECNGSGEVFDRMCDLCNGQKEVTSKEEIEIELKPNLVEGSTLIHKGKGNFNRGASTPGDLVVVIRETPHKEFYREDEHNVGKTVEVNYEDFVLGREDLQVKTISDKKINVKVPKGVDPDKKLRVKNEGMPKDEKGNNKGDMLLKLKLKIPKNPSKEEEKVLEKLKALHEDSEVVDKS